VNAKSRGRFQPKQRKVVRRAHKKEKKWKEGGGGERKKKGQRKEFGGSEWIGEKKARQPYNSGGGLS